LAPTARRVSSIASRLPGTTSLRFAFPGWQRPSHRSTGLRSASARSGNPLNQIHHTRINAHV
ncbi:MAG: hypothetical protein ABW068_16220, partial [Candidatus Thiodiazotropha sp.]